MQRRVHPSHAEDVVADVFLAAWRRLDDIPGAEPAPAGSDPAGGDPAGGDHPAGDEEAGFRASRAWLFGIARHTMQNSHRGQTRGQALGVRIAHHTPGSGDSADDDLSAQRLDLAAAWPRLSATDQEAIALTAWDGLTAPEAATVLHISPVAFRLRLSRARRTLRKLVAQCDNEPHRSLRSTQPRTRP